jgi:hypothetical protein
VAAAAEEPVGDPRELRVHRRPAAALLLARTGLVRGRRSRRWEGKDQGMEWRGVGGEAEDLLGETETGRDSLAD